MNQNDALRLIAARAPSISGEAAKALLTTSIPQRRLSRVVLNALRDPEANWTLEERAGLVEFITPEPDETRGERVYLRLTPAEKAQLQADADAETDGNLSELARRRALGR
jgi:proline racemase